MSRPVYSKEELESSGKEYPFTKLPFFPDDLNSDPQLKKPISPCDNMKLLLSGEKPYWIPYGSPFVSDVLDFRPRQCADNFANHQCFDGEAMPDWANYPLTTRGWFDLEWEFVPQVGGATVHPGHPIITDMNDWQTLNFPDLDALDWEEIAKNESTYLTINKYKYLSVQCSFFERLMVLMDTAEACMAIIDEDQEDAIHAFFDRYADFMIEYIRRVKEVCPSIDGVYAHDDWAHQNGPFISPATARRMLLAPTKKLIDAVHEMGMFFTIHCCGYAEMMIPLFEEMGADLWDGQETANDFGKYAKEYKDYHLAFMLPPPQFPEGMTNEELDKAAWDWVQEYKDCRVVLKTCNMSTNEFIDKRFREKVYEYSRKALENA